MLSDTPVTATIGVSDMDKAKKFYTETLGLTGKEEFDGGMTLSCGKGTSLFIYQSAGAGTSKATSATWTTDDFDGTLKELRDKGVKFEDYDNPDFKTVDGVSTYGTMKSAWFKDPDGNILNINNGG